MLRARDWLHGHQRPADLADIAWFSAEGTDIAEPDWHDGTIRQLVLRRAAGTPAGTAAVLTVLLNAGSEAATFRLPPPAMRRTLLLDSADPDGAVRPIEGDRVTVAAHALLVLSAERTAEETDDAA